MDNALVQAQAQSRLLQDIERALNASKDYLHKVCLSFHSVYADAYICPTV